MTAIPATDQLGVDAHSLSSFTHAALEDCIDAESPTELLDVNGFALVGEHGIAGSDMKTRYLGQIRNDVLGDTVAEVLLLGIAAHVDEWQDGDRGLFSGRRGRRGRYNRSANDAISAHWL